MVLVSHRKPLMFYVGFLLIASVVVASNENIRNKFLSTFIVQRKGDVITSTNESNASRLHMWRVASDLFKENPFFGIGFQNSPAALKAFVAKQDDSYRATLISRDYSFTDQHSSYFSILLQFGGIYFLFIYGLFISILIGGRKDLIFMPALACTGLIYFFYSGVVSFEAVVFFGLLTMLMLRSSPVKIKE